MADGEKENLQGTIEFNQARTNAKVTIAAERLAVIAAITLPVTAVSSIHDGAGGEILREAGDIRSLNSDPSRS